MPAMISITFNDVTPTLDELQAKIDDMTEFALMVGQLWSDQMAYNFATANWAPLAAATVAYKMEHGYPMAPLFRTQELRNAAASGDWSGGSNEATMFAPGYGAFHIDGTGFMPARDFTFLESSFDQELADTAAGFFLGD